MKKYGIMSPNNFREMTMAIARGEYKLPSNAPREYYEDEKTAKKYHKSEVLAWNSTFYDNVDGKNKTSDYA